MAEQNDYAEPDLLESDKSHNFQTLSCTLGLNNFVYFLFNVSY